MCCSTQQYPPDRNYHRNTPHTDPSPTYPNNLTHTLLKTLYFQRFSSLGYRLPLAQDSHEHPSQEASGYGSSTNRSVPQTIHAEVGKCHFPPSNSSLPPPQSHCPSHRELRITFFPLKIPFSLKTAL